MNVTDRGTPSILTSLSSKSSCKNKAADKVLCYPTSRTTSVMRTSTFKQLPHEPVKGAVGPAMTTFNNPADHLAGGTRHCEKTVGRLSGKTMPSIQHEEESIRSEGHCIELPSPPSIDASKANEIEHRKRNVSTTKPSMAVSPSQQMYAKDGNSTALVPVTKVVPSYSARYNMATSAVVPSYAVEYSMTASTLHSELLPSFSVAPTSRSMTVDRQTSTELTTSTMEQSSSSKNLDSLTTELNNLKEQLEVQSKVCTAALKLHIK